MKDKFLHFLEKGIALLGLCLFFLYFSGVVSFAASKPINSIHIQIYSKLESGDSPGEIFIEKGEIQKHEVTVRGKSSLFTITAAEWGGQNKSTVKVGEELELLLTLSPTDVTDNYFLASYRASSFHITGGYYVSAKREGDDLVLTLKMKAVEGAYDAPVSVDWNEKSLGSVRWQPGEVDSGVYSVQLFRDGTRIHEIEKLSGNQYNFYPYMTKAGRYMVKVKTLVKDAKERKYARGSGYTESSDLQIRDRDVSDGKGKEGEKVQAGTEKKIGWEETDGSYIFRLPSGELYKGWGKIDGYWYYFQPDGKMVKGWQKIQDKWYFFQESGAMAVGWVKDQDQWYYLIPETEATNGQVAGELFAGDWRVIQGRYYYFEADGKMHTGWLFWQGRWYYCNELDNSLLGVMFTGFLTRNEKTYYLNSNGAMDTGWQKIDGDWRYFQEESGEMLKNTSVGGFPLNGDGIFLQGEFGR